jgi:hypothetical protein
MAHAALCAGVAAASADAAVAADCTATLLALLDQASRAKRDSRLSLRCSCFDTKLTPLLCLCVALCMVCCCCCSTELVDRVPSDMEGLAESFERLQHSLQQAQEYVDDVVVSGCGRWVKRVEPQVHRAAVCALRMCGSRPHSARSSGSTGCSTVLHPVPRPALLAPLFPQDTPAHPFPRACLCRRGGGLPTL